jgi:rhamnose transport system ATP-binding protein
MNNIDSYSAPYYCLKGIFKAFDGVHALQDASFELRRGEVHALLGENGAGKSTLVKIMTGVHQPDTGEIRLDGTAVSFRNPLDARRRGIAAMYQEPSIFPDLSIAENIFAGSSPVKRPFGNIDWHRMIAEADRLLKPLGMSRSSGTKARGLSIADQQLVEMARALSVNAGVLIMDEPTSSLTQHEITRLFSIVRQLREKGAGIVFISHRLEEVLALADRVTILRDGRYVGTRPAKDASADELIRMMVGRPLDALFPKAKVQMGEVCLKVEGLGREGAFRDVSFDLRQGEILGLAGLVGARRTDVARAIFGIAPADRGQMRIDGRIATIGSPREAMSLGLAYVPSDRQHHGLVLPMSVAANIILPILREFKRFGLIDNAAERRRSCDSADRLEVKAAGVWQAVRELSGGNQQKVVLAKWLGTRPRILILHEPTRGIDVATKAAVYRLMGTLVSQGMAILMISSELPEILGLSDRIIVIQCLSQRSENRYIVDCKNSADVKKTDKCP